MIIKVADESNDRKIPRMDSEYAMGYDLTMELLHEGKKFTAIAGQNDMMLSEPLMRSVRCAFMYQKTFRLLAVIIFFIPVSKESR